MPATIENVITKGKLRIVDLGFKIPSNFQPGPNSYGYLYIPNHQFSIHPASLQRLIAYGMRTGKPCQFVPQVPVSSKLGLPPFPPLAFWLPEIETVTFKQRLELLMKREQVPSIQQRVLQRIEQETFEVFSENPIEEQIFYYSDHYVELAEKPIQCSVIVTNSCNLKCVMCPYHSPVIRPTHSTDFFDEAVYMKWETMQKLAEECGRDNIPVKIGNIEEPLLHPQIVDFIALCRSKGAPTAHITSNGLLLNDNTAKALLEAGLTSLYISIDAARVDTYKRVRGANLEKVENNLRNFLRLRKEMNKNCLVMVSFIRNEGVTKEEEDEFREKWQHEVDGVIIYNLAEYVKGNARVKNVNTVTEQFMKEAGGRWACLNPWQEMYVLPDGRVYYCCETVSKLAHEQLISMGDYHHQSLKEIWGGDTFKKLRVALLTNTLEEWSACKDCGIWMAHVCGTEEKEDTRIVTNMMTEIFYQK